MPTIYRVMVEEASADGSHPTVWAPSKGAASKARTAMMEEEGVKRADITVDAVEITGGKAGLIEWLNENVKLL